MGRACEAVAAGKGLEGGPIPTGMVDDFELEQLRRHPEWRTTLTVYHDLQATARAQSPEFDGWIHA